MFFDLLRHTIFLILALVIVTGIVMYAVVIKRIWDYFTLKEKEEEKEREFRKKF